MYFYDDFPWYILAAAVVVVGFFVVIFSDPPPKQIADPRAQARDYSDQRRARRVPAVL